MKEHERGSTLVLVLLVILVLSVLGISLMGNVVGENKRTNATESGVQARYLAKSGLVYFEAAFKDYIQKNAPDSINIISFLNNYKDWVTVGDVKETGKPEQTEIKAELTKELLVKVTSKAKAGSSTKTLVGYYKLDVDVDIDKPILALSDFTNNGRAIDFTDLQLVGVDLSLLNLKLIDIRGSDTEFYRVPVDQVIGVNLLGPILGISIGDGERFDTLEKNRVIATRDSDAVGLDLFEFEQDKGALVSVNLINYGRALDTNVIIDGGFTAFELLGIRFNGYRDIDFKKFGIMGNGLIQQDRDGNEGLTADDEDSRRFTFVEGLFVNKSLTIGGIQGGSQPANKVDKYSKLLLRGNMAVMDNLSFADADVVFGDSSENESLLKPEDYISNLYVKGNADIKNSCIKPKNDQYDFHLFSEGKISIVGNKLSADCNTFKGLFYAKNGLEITTNNQPMTIIGGVFGDVHVDYPDKLTIISDPKYLETVKFSNVKLITKGKTVEK